MAAAYLMGVVVVVVVRGFSRDVSQRASRFSLVDLAFH
jgi:hypothetical protein